MPVPGSKPSLPASGLTATTTSRSTSPLAGAPLLTVFEKWGISAPAPALADPSSNPQQLQQPLNANLARVTAPPPLPIQPPVAPSPQPQPGPVVASPVPLAAGSRAGAPLPAVFEKGGVSAPSLNLADRSSNPLPQNQQPLAPSRPTFASVAAPSPLPIPQSFAIPASIGKPGTPNPQSPQDQPAPTAISAVPISAVPISAVPVTAGSREIPAAARPDDSRAANAPANSAVPNELRTEPGPRSSELPSAIGPAASGDAHSSANLSTQPPAAPAPSSTASVSVSAMPTGLVSPGPVSPAPALPTQTQSDSPAPPVPVSPVPTAADSRFHAPVPTGAPDFSLDYFPLDDFGLGQSLIVESPSVPAAPSTPAQPVLASAYRPSPASLNGPAANVAPASSAPATAPSPMSMSMSMPMMTTTSPTPIPAPQSSANNNSAPVTESPNAQQTAAPNASAAKNQQLNAGGVGVIQLRGRARRPQTGQLDRRGFRRRSSRNRRLAMLHTAPVVTLSPDATTVAAQTASASETGFAIANGTSNNDPAPLTPNLAPSSQNPAPMAAPLAASTHDAPSNGRPGVSPQPVSAAAPATAGDKKSSAAMQADPAAAHDAPSAIASGRDSSPALTAPAPPASAPPTQGRSDPAPELPKTHQMLDSAPPLPPPAPIAPGSAADLQTNAQMNAQMHLGVRTDAFGAVEIHTVVQQSQVGITVHADRDLAHWFSSEVSSLESGLNKNHLNLTAVDFDNGRSGVQTATSFQQGQPRHSFSQSSSSQTSSSQTTGSQSAAPPDPASPEPDTASESATTGILLSGLSAGSGQTHVSILV